MAWRHGMGNLVSDHPQVHRSVELDDTLRREVSATEIARQLVNDLNGDRRAIDDIDHRVDVGLHLVVGNDDRRHHRHRASQPLVEDMPLHVAVVEPADLQAVVGELRPGGDQVEHWNHQERERGHDADDPP